MNTARAICCSFILTVGPVAVARAADNQLTIQVTGGAYAGRYQTGKDTTICMQAAARDVFSSAWKDFEATGKALAEAGVEIRHPDAPGAKRGLIRLSFGKDGKAAIYQVDAPVTLTLTAQGARIAADARTAEGIGIHLEALCAQIERL